MLCYTILYCTALHCTILYYTVLYYTTSHHVILVDIILRSQQSELASCDLPHCGSRYHSEKVEDTKIVLLLQCGAFMLLGPFHVIQGLKIPPTTSYRALNKAGHSDPFTNWKKW